MNPRPQITPHNSMAEAGRKVLNFHFQQMLQNEAGTRLGEDIRALHRMRVATRRMRAAFRTIRPYYRPAAIKLYRKGLKSTARVLGAVRDWDVLLEKTQAYVDSLPPGERTSLEFLMGSWAQERQAAREKLLIYLDSKTYRNFKHAFSKFVQLPGDELIGLRSKNELVSEEVPSLIVSQYEQVLKHEENFQNPSVEQLHALRIDFKRLRYTIEFFRGVLGPTTAFCIEEIKILQDHLGDLNDAVVAIQKTRSFLASQNGNQIMAVQVGKFLAAKEAELNHLMETFPQVWECFRQPEFFQNLEAALKALDHPL